MTRRHLLAVRLLDRTAVAVYLALAVVGLAVALVGRRPLAAVAFTIAVTVLGVLLWLDGGRR